MSILSKVTGAASRVGGFFYSKGHQRRYSWPESQFDRKFSTSSAEEVMYGGDMNYFHRVSSGKEAPVSSDPLCHEVTCDNEFGITKGGSLERLTGVSYDNKGVPTSFEGLFGSAVMVST